MEERMEPAKPTSLPEAESLDEGHLLHGGKRNPPQGSATNLAELLAPAIAYSCTFCIVIRMSSSTKETRQAVIREILGRGPIANQQELCAALEARGIRTGQTTISRDAKELGLIRSTEGYQLPGRNGSAATKSSAPTLPRAGVPHVLSVELAGNLVVLSTPAGLAQHVALTIDHQARKGVVGTIAGDDTVFVAMKSEQAGKRLRDALRKGPST